MSIGGSRGRGPRGGGEEGEGEPALCSGAAASRPPARPAPSWRRPALAVARNLALIGATGKRPLLVSKRPFSPLLSYPAFLTLPSPLQAQPLWSVQTWGTARAGGLSFGVAFWAAAKTWGSGRRALKC